MKEKKLTAELQKLESESNSTIDSQEQTVTAMPKAVRRSLILLLMSVFFWYMAYNGVMTSFSKYAQDVLGLAGGEFANVLLVATVTAVLSFIPVGLLPVIGDGNARYCSVLLLCLLHSPLPTSSLAIIPYEYPAWSCRFWLGSN